MYKLHVKKFMKERGLAKEDLENNETIKVPPLKVKEGFFKTKEINLREIEKEISLA